MAKLCGATGNYRCPVSWSTGPGITCGPGNSIDPLLLSAKQADSLSFLQWLWLSGLIPLNSCILFRNFPSRLGLTIEGRPKKNELGSTLQEHLQCQILAVLTASVPGGRPNLVRPYVGIESLP